MKEGCTRKTAGSLAAGFTLVEMVISVAVMTLVLSAGYGCLRSGFLSQKLVETRFDAFQSARVALNLMAADLRAASRLSDRFEFLGISREIGESEADNLDFGTRNYQPKAEGEGDFAETSYFLRKNPQSGLLTLFRRIDASPDNEPLQGGKEQILADGIRGLRFEYYDGFDWFDEWGDPQGKRKGQPDLRARSNLSGLPEAVRITLSVRVAPSPRGRDATSVTSAETGRPEEDASFVVQTVARLPRSAPASVGSRAGANTSSPSSSTPATGGAP